MLIDSAGQPGASSRPDETAPTTCHGVTAPSTNRPRTALKVAVIAVSASAQRVPAGAGITGSGSSARNHRVNTTRTASNRPANRRNQPRTVSTGRPNTAAIDRNPTPRARAVSAAPITASVSARRSNSPTGNNTCVVPHRVQRERRGRTRTRP